jgi:hypothetical protein
VQKIRVAQDRDRWQAFVSAAMNVRVKCEAKSFLTG